MAHWRSLAGLSQGQVEDKTGINLTVVSRIETGKRDLKGQLEQALLDCYERVLRDRPEKRTLFELLAERREHVAQQIRQSPSIESLKLLLDFYSQREPYAAASNAPHAVWNLADTLRGEASTVDALRQQLQLALDLAIREASRLEPAEQAFHLMALRNLIRNASKLESAQIDSLETLATDRLLGLTEP